VKRLVEEAVVEKKLVEVPLAPLKLSRVTNPLLSTENKVVVAKAAVVEEIAKGRLLVEEAEGVEKMAS
jgi:hypothetical protein